MAGNLADRLLDGRDEKLPWPTGAVRSSPPRASTASAGPSPAGPSATWPQAGDPRTWRSSPATSPPTAPCWRASSPRPRLAAPACPAAAAHGARPAADGAGPRGRRPGLRRRADGAVQQLLSPGGSGRLYRRSALVAQLLVRHGNVLEGREPYAHAGQWLAGTHRAFRGPGGRATTSWPRPSITNFAASARRVSPRRAGCWRPCSTGSRPSPPAARWPSSLPRRSGSWWDWTYPAQPRRRYDAGGRPAGLLRHRSRAGRAGVAGGTGPPACAVRQWADLLASSLALASCPPERQTGAILAASAMDMRAVPVKHVWLVGCNDGVFPAPVSQQRFFNEADRQAYGQRGCGARFAGRPGRPGTAALLPGCQPGNPKPVDQLAVRRRRGPRPGSQPAGGGTRPPAGRAGRKVTRLPTAQFAPPPALVTSPADCLNLAFCVARRPPGAAG